MANTGNMSVAPELADIKGTGFDPLTDSLVKIRDEQTLIEGAGFVSANHSIKKVWDDTDSINNLTSYLGRTGGNLNVNVQDTGVLTDLKLAVEKKCIPTEDLLFSNDAFITGTDAVYTLMKSTVSGVSGIIRVKFDLRGQGGGGTAFGKIYKNGVAFGTEQVCVGVDYTTFSEDLIFESGETIEVWFYALPVNSYNGQNFRMYGAIYTEFTNLIV